MSNWTVRPTKFTDAVEEDIGEVAERVAIKMLRGLIFSSPVDTGRFRGAWVVGLKKRNTSAPDEGNVIGAPNLGIGISIIKRHKKLDPIFISNNLPYAKRLNDGYSGQAPANFVERAIKRAVK